MKFMKRVFGGFHKFSYEITTCVRFCLSYDPFDWDFLPSNEQYFNKKKHIADTDVFNDVTCSCQIVITRVFI